MKIYYQKRVLFFLIFLFVLMACRQGSRSNGQADYEGKAGQPNDTMRNYNPPSQVYQGTDSMGSTDTVKRDSGYMR